LARSHVGTGFPVVAKFSQVLPSRASDMPTAIGPEKKASGQLSQPSLPAIRQAIMDRLSLVTARHCPHCEIFLEALPPTLPPKQ
jgi:hypothetical protein